MPKKLIALVGRPNVGKSTLFNRLSERKRAIVHDLPGVTRDRKYADARIGPISFKIVDTPGLEESEEGELEHRMMQQTIQAIKEADLVCLVVDNINGITPADKFFANFIRKYNQNHIVIANKCEKSFIHDKEFYKLGFGDPIPISAEHGHGMVGLYEAIIEKIGEEEGEDIDPMTGDLLQMVIVGRPNAGKSTFVNAILDDNRLLTGAEAGITRESIEVEWQHNGHNLRLIDTAGLRKRANVTKSLEKLSTGDSIGSIKFANTVILILDATIALEHQDLSIANYVINEGRSLIIAVNKWDLINLKRNYEEEFAYKLEKLLPQIKGVPVVFMSAINKNKVNEVLDEGIRIYDLWNKKLSTSKLNDWLKYVTNAHPLPIIKKLGRRVKLKYVTQIKTRPPTFKFFTNDPASITEAYKRYLLNSMRDNFSMPGVPIRILFVKTKNPYLKK